MKCSVCGCENEDNVTVCAVCGTQLSSATVTVTCCHCGKQIRPNARYCVYCGGNQTQPPVAVPNNAPIPEELPAAEETVPAAAEALPEEEIPAEENVSVAAEEPAATEEPDAVPAPQPPQIIYVPQIAAPAYQLPAHRGFWKMLLLGIITGMLYPLVIMSRISVEINMVASRHDGKRTMHFLWMPVIGTLTLGVYFFVWIHKLCGRIGAELRRRQIAYKFGAASFWLWNFLYGMVGAVVTVGLYFILANMGVDAPLAILAAGAAAIASSVGSCIFIHKLMRAMNLMNADYNEKG